MSDELKEKFDKLVQLFGEFATELRKRLSEIAEDLACFENIDNKVVRVIISSPFDYGNIELTNTMGITEMMAKRYKVLLDIGDHHERLELFKERRMLYKSKIKDHQWIKPIKINYSNGWRC